MGLLESLMEKTNMKIKEITYQHRRDFHATFECEHCGDEVKKTSCYDDNHYHTVVIPKMECSKCGKAAGANYRPLQTKYPDGVFI